MEGPQDGYYTAMVLGASGYRDPVPQRKPPPPPQATLVPHYRTNTFSSTNSSSSTNSASQSGWPMQTYRTSGVPRLLPAAPSAVSSGSTGERAAVALPLSPALTVTTKTYTHNPYCSCVTTGSLSGENPNSITSSLDSYRSFQASYEDSPVPSTTDLSIGMKPRLQRLQQPLAIPADLQQQQRQQQQQPVYAPASGDARMMTSNLTEQFLAAVGSIAQAACTARGRHMLISTLRLQHLDKVEVIYEEIAPAVNVVATDANGCHVLRTLIEYITTAQMEKMTPFFSAKTVLDLASSSQNSRRALQAIFENHRSETFTPMVELIAMESPRLAMMQQGCISIMRIFEHSMPSQKQLLVSHLLPVFPALTMDPYGNYVVQCVLDNVDSCTTMPIICEAFSGHWVPLSCNKFASNVMEKIVRHVVGLTRQQLVSELVMEARNLHCLLQDGFGNFVLQAIIDSAVDKDEFSEIYTRVAQHLHSSPYGHKIEAKLKAKNDYFFPCNAAAKSKRKVSP